MGKFGDEAGLFWLPAPGATRTRGGNGGAGGKRQPREHIPRGAEPTSDWTPPRELPRITRGNIGLDFETYDPGLNQTGSNWCKSGIGHIAGFSIAWGEGELYYPIRHEQGGNLDEEKGFQYLEDIVKNPDVQLIAHNGGYDLGWLWGRRGIKPARPIFDTQSAVALLDEYRQRNNLMYNLNAVARDYCGVLKDETLLDEALLYYFGSKSKDNLHRLHSKFVGPYGETDAGLVLQVWDTIRPLMIQEDLMPIFDLEMRYLVVVTAMRMRGVRVDIPRAERFNEELKRQSKHWAKVLRDLAGFDVPFMASDAISKAFDKAGIPYPRTEPSKNHPNGQPSFTSPWLKTVDHPLAKAIFQGRRVDKVRGTFVEGFFLKLAHNGRVWPQIHPLPTDDSGTVSGRSSCSDPNLQQLSAKDPEMAREVRGLCLPEEGAEWAALDYSQQEPRLAVHFALLAGVPGAQVIATQYRKNPRTDFHQLVADLAASMGHPLDADPKKARGRSKILNLAIIYGKGEAATCKELGFETEIIKMRGGETREVAGPEGKAFISQYHDMLPFVSGLKDACKRAVKKKGFIRTLLGRRCRFGEGKSRDHTAVNRLVQGSAADQLKKANVDMYEQLGEIPLVNVHDEIGMNKWSQKQIEAATQCMVDTTPLEVPVVVDVATGANWGEAL